MAVAIGKGKSIKACGEKEEGNLQYDRQQVNDNEYFPLLECCELDLSFPPPIGDISNLLDSCVMQDPLFCRNREKGGKQCEGQTSEKKGLGEVRGRLGTEPIINDGHLT